MKEVQENKSSQIEVFLNSVPMLASLSREEKLKLASVLEEQTFKPKEKIVEEVRPHPSLSMSRFPLYTNSHPMLVFCSGSQQSMAELAQRVAQIELAILRH